MTKTSRSNNQAQVVIAAAADVVANGGVQKLTIDAVAKQAGMSKGGVLYHFPNKQALLTGMLGQLIDTLESRRASHQSQSKLLAMLHTIDLNDVSERAISLAILAVSAEQPDLLGPAKKYYQSQVAAVEKESDDPELAGILLMALEGVRLITMLDINPWSKTQTRRILKRMHQLGAEASL